MNENIIKFYLTASELKNSLRTGWAEVGIPSEKIESVAEHICGSMLLTIGIMSEKDYSNLDLVKVFKMLLVRELPKAVTEEQSVLSSEENKNTNRDNLERIVNDLKIKDELLALYDEAASLESNEAKFAMYVSKLESDLQAKKYELVGDFTLEKALEDVKNFKEDVKNEILPQVKKASDGWLLFDRRYYNDETFISLSENIQNL